MFKNLRNKFKKLTETYNKKSNEIDSFLKVETIKLEIYKVLLNVKNDPSNMRMLVDILDSKLKSWKVYFSQKDELDSFIKFYKPEILLVSEYLKSKYIEDINDIINPKIYVKDSKPVDEQLLFLNHIISEYFYSNNLSKDEQVSVNNYKDETIENYKNIIAETQQLKREYKSKAEKISIEIKNIYQQLLN